jgi:excisionase family DNA binding protein
MVARKNYSPDEKSGFTGIDGASSILGISKSTLYKLTSNCKVPHFKVGAKLIFKISDLIQLIEQSRVNVVN